MKVIENISEKRVEDLSSRRTKSSSFRGCSRRIIRRLLRYISLVNSDEVVYKSKSTLVSGPTIGRMSCGELEPTYQRASSLVIESSASTTNSNSTVVFSGSSGEERKIRIDQITKRETVSKWKIWYQEDFEKIWKDIDSGFAIKVRGSLGLDTWVKTCSEFNKEWERLGGRDVYTGGWNYPNPNTLIRGRVKSCDILTLNGGVRTKKRYRNNKRRQRKRTPMVAAKQEGMINRWTPVDPPVRTVMRYNGILTSDSSGVVQHRFSLRNPSRAQNGTGNYNGAVGFANLYDEYKVVRFVLQYEPSIAVGNTVTGALYVAADYDSDDLSNQNLSNVSEYGKYKNFDSRKGWEYMTKVPSLTSGITFDGDGNLESAVPIHSGGFMDFARAPVTGCVFVAGDTFPANTAIGRVVASMVMIVRRRR